MNNKRTFLLPDRLRRRYRAWQFSHTDGLKQGRDFFVIEYMLIAVAFNLSGGYFLAGFLKHIGISDALNGFIAVLPALVGVFQPFGAYIIGMVAEKKRYIVKMATIQRITYAMLFILPVVIVGLWAKTFIVVAIVIVFHLLANILNPAFIDWIAKLSPVGLRGKYLSVREMTVVLTVAVCNLGAGLVLDVFKGRGNETGGYLLLGAVIFVLTVGNLFIMSKVHYPNGEEQDEQIDLKAAYTEPFADKPFRKCLIVSAIWNFAFQLSIPYIIVYFVSFINLDFSFIMIVGFFATFERLLTIKLWLRLAEKRSWNYVTQMALFLAGGIYICHIFLTKSNAWWLYVVLTLAVNVPWTILVSALLNFQLSFAPSEKRSAYIGANAAFQGIIGFMGGLLGAWLMSVMGKGMIFNMTAPQILILAGGMLMIGAAMYIRRSIIGKEV